MTVQRKKLDSLRKDYVINRGIIITLTPSDTEKLIRDKIVSSLKPRYPMIENRDFEFFKVVQKKICSSVGKRNTV